MSKLKLQGNASGTGTITLASGDTSSNVTFTLPTADGSSGQFMSTDGSGNLSFASGVSAGSANTFTAAQTFRAANAVRSEAASTQDAIVVAGRAGGTSSYAVTLTPTTLSANRTVTFPDETFTVGYINAPQSTNTTLALTDQGKHVYFTGGSTATLSVPTNASVAFPTGTTILVVNNNSGNLTIQNATSGVTFQLANGATGNRTVATKGMATLLYVGSDTWYVSGAGVT